MAQVQRKVYCDTDGAFLIWRACERRTAELLLHAGGNPNISLYAALFELGLNWCAQSNPSVNRLGRSLCASLEAACMTAVAPALMGVLITALYTPLRDRVPDRFCH
nr:hypothetical protein [uncultured Duganella sp.]